MSKAIVIINEQHNLMEDQVRILNEQFESFERENIPQDGMTLKEIENLANWLIDKRFEDGSVTVFASPIPALIKFVVQGSEENEDVRVFHNDNREKKELPNGKIIMTVAQTGWVLV